jgi:2-keto-4-pentenoate hydratase/2-oxohepta-3-ene-1,7-dioic acid hydratase in catechol pathway
MRLVTFEPAAGCERLGLWIGDTIVDLFLAADRCFNKLKVGIPTVPADMMSFLNQGQPAIAAAAEVAAYATDALAKGGPLTGRGGGLIAYDIKQVRLRAPVPRPPKILCMALNYPAHASGMNIVVPEKPYIFAKPGFYPVVGAQPILHLRRGIGGRDRSAVPVGPPAARV